jgi:hypothetical protein
MNTREILSIVALAALGLCLLCELAKMTMKGTKAKQRCNHACSLSLFVAVVLVGVSQLLKENKDGYTTDPPPLYQSMELIGKSFDEETEVDVLLKAVKNKVCGINAFNKDGSKTGSSKLYQSIKLTGTSFKGEGKVEVLLKAVDRGPAHDDPHRCGINVFYRGNLPG